MNPVVLRQVDCVWLVGCIAMAALSHGADPPDVASRWILALLTMGTAITLYLLFVLAGRFKPLLIFTLVFVSGDMVLRLTYDSAITVSAWASLVNATSGELWSFIEAQWLWLIIAACTLLAGIIIPAPTLPKHWLPGTAASCIVFVGAAAFQPLPDDQSVDYWQRRLALGTPKELIKFELVLKNAAAHLPFLDSVVGLIQTASYMANKNAAELNAWENVSQSKTAAELLVVVIGESLRADHMSVYGYHRDTTPGLRAAGDEISVYPYAYSAGTNTWNSLPIAFTKYSHTTDMSLSFVTLAQAAGYKAHWLSNQTPNDEWGLAVSIAARQADTHLFIPVGKPTYPKDGELIPIFDDVLAQRELGEKTLVVLHMYGSHSNFSDRYPPEFEVFSPAKNKGQKERRIAHYDNSIRYTDSLLTRVIETTERLDGSFLFFADHGLKSAQRRQPLVHDIAQKTSMDSLHVPLILAGRYQDRLPRDHVYSLYYFECIFSAWSGITASQITDNDYCKSKLSSEEIQYLKPDLTIGRAKPPHIQ